MQTRTCAVRTDWRCCESRASLRSTERPRLRAAEPAGGKQAAGCGLQGLRRLPTRSVGTGFDSIDVRTHGRVESEPPNLRDVVVLLVGARVAADAAADAAVVPPPDDGEARVAEHAVQHLRHCESHRLSCVTSYAPSASTVSARVPKRLDHLYAGCGATQQRGGARQ